MVTSKFSSEFSSEFFCEFSSEPTPSYSFVFEKIQEVVEKDLGSGRKVFDVAKAVRGEVRARWDLRKELTEEVFVIEFILAKCFKREYDGRNIVWH